MPFTPFVGDPTGRSEGTAVHALSGRVPRPDNPCWADYSYAHGGKDGHPFPVDRQTYDQSIAVLTDVVRKARLGNAEKTDALRRLTSFSPIS